jgi:poly(hydroxyalkanoate) depolymerase family esterase
VTSNTSASEAQRRRIIHGAASALASIDPDGESYEIKLAELESHLAQQADRKDSVRPQPLVGQGVADVPGAGTTFWRAHWTRQKGRFAKARGALARVLRRTVSWRNQHPARLPARHPDHVAYDVGSLATAVQSGRFTEATLRVAQFGESRQRRYMLYEPANRSQSPAPLLVLLHGCKQDAADFAAGTRMNEAAEAAGVVVLYPEQSLAANLLRCWNWYALHDRSNKDGDASVIAAMTRQVMRQHDIDAKRVYVAGMSAGGGMAAVLVRDYPELYAALGVHSGVPAGHAHDAYSAMRLMSSGPVPSDADAVPDAVDRVSTNVASIVFHGDDDAVVHLSNGVAIHAGSGGSQVPLPLDMVQATTQPRLGHRGFTRSVEYGPSGAADRELWIVHGAGHAWAGGDGAQQHTDSSGPDASGEMLRFFLQHQLST